ncbi:MAG: hypothetical protein ACRYFZ_04550 [Janthinobacterium lividum]
MKKLYVVVAFGLGWACPATVQAQVDFRPGYIVRPAGDTVRGDIDYRDARFNARQCRFRRATKRILAGAAARV